MRFVHSLKNICEQLLDIELSFDDFNNLKLREIVINKETFKKTLDIIS